jgi:hypothetical protein
LHGPKHIPTLPGCLFSTAVPTKEDPGAMGQGLSPDG